MSGTSPLTATLTLTESGAHASSFAVDWGDTTAVETVPGGTVMTDHTYASAGTFNGRVTPTIFGLPGSVIPIPAVTVTAAPPYSVIPTVAPLAGVAPLDVALTLAESNGAATSFDVDWGDGTAIETLTAAGGPHTYAAAGSFTVSVTPTVGGIVQAAVTVGPVVVS
jgi:5'-nucleotidase